jgi:hypothetical protein
MIAKSLHMTVHITEFEDGSVVASVSTIHDNEHQAELLRTSYSSASSCFEEVASLTDAILWSWCLIRKGLTTRGATG